MKSPQLLTVANLFQGEARYRAPIFQRYYTWADAELEKMFEDIEGASVDAPIFLGAIVLQDVGRLKGPGSPTEFLMVDGQQRLTTLTLLIAGLAWLAKEHGAVGEATDLVHTYLTRPSGEYAGWPNLIPTVQDRKQLWHIFQEELQLAAWNFEHDPHDEANRKKIHQQWRRIKSQLAERLLTAQGRLQKREFVKVLGNVLDGLRMVVITLDTDDDANFIFSKLNAQGQPLQLSDLVRNDVFSRFSANQQKKAARFYDERWSKFEKDFPEGAFDNYFPIYAYIKFKGNATKSEAFPKLQQSWKSHSAQKILDELQQYAPYHQSLSEFRPIPSLNKTLTLRMERLSRMPKTTVTWPFLLQVLGAAEDHRLTWQRAAKCLDIVEAFLVRRALVGWEPTGLHAVFKKLWEKSEGDPQKVARRIITSTIKCPDDKMLRDAIVRDAVDRRTVIRYVLEEYEHGLINRRGYDPLPVGKMTVEHVMPQNLSRGWKRICTQSEHRDLVGTIGNLAPLSGKQNASVQDRPWENKKKRFHGSNWKMTQALAKKQNWTATVIRSRNKQMADWMLERWPDPAPNRR